MSLNPTATSLSFSSSTSTCLISVKQPSKVDVPSTFGKAPEGHGVCEVRGRLESRSKDEAARK